MRRALWIGGALVGLWVLLWAMVPAMLPRLFEWYYPDIVFRGDGRRKVLYLTIDDSPTQRTGEILKVLAKHRVPATFFVISGRIRADSDLRAIVQAGHSLGNHLRTTRACSKLTLDEFKSDFDDTDRQIKRFSSSHYFRPPSGSCTTEQAEYARSRGYTPVLGTIYPLDAQIQRQAVLRFLIKWLTIRGGILIMHDGEARATTTAAVLNDIIPNLKRQGFEFAPLAELTRSGKE